MQIMLIVVVVLLLAEASILVATPALAKAALDQVTPAQLRLAGLIELAIAVPALIAVLSG